MQCIETEIVNELGVMLATEQKPRLRNNLPHNQ
jgi:hypothetical protein